MYSTILVGLPGFARVSTEICTRPETIKRHDASIKLYPWNTLGGATSGSIGPSLTGPHAKGGREGGEEGGGREGGREGGTDGRTDGGTDGRTDGPTDRRTDGGRE